MNILQNIILKQFNENMYKLFYIPAEYLNDLYDDIHEIAEKILTDIPVFKSIPENPKEVKTLLENGLMIFKPKIFPVFSKIKPHDLNEVLTWDDRFLLVGTKVENLKVYSYEE